MDGSGWARRFRALSLLQWVLIAWIAVLLAYVVIGGDGVWWKF
jgi:hypothetical protein